MGWFHTLSLIAGPAVLPQHETFLFWGTSMKLAVCSCYVRGRFGGSASPDEAVRALVDLANLRGGPDNITVQVARLS